MTKQYDVYVAYARADKACADRLYSILDKYGVSCFQEEKSLVAGMDFAATIQDAIGNAKIVIVVCSKNAEQSAWLKKEVEYALSLGKTIVPVLEDEVDFSELKGMSSLIQGLRWYRLSEFEHNIRSFGELAFVNGPSGVEDSEYDIAPNYHHQSPPYSASPRMSYSPGQSGCIKKVVIVGLIVTAVIVMTRHFWTGTEPSTPHEQSKPYYETAFPYHGSQPDEDDVVIVDTFAYDSTMAAEVVIPDDPMAPDTMAVFIEPTFPTNNDEPDSLKNVIQSLRDDLVKKDNILSVVEKSCEYYQEKLKRQQTGFVWLSIALLLAMLIGCWLMLKYRKLSKIKSSLSLTADINGDGELNESHGFPIIKGKPSTLPIDRGTQKLKLDFAAKNKPKRLSCFIAGSTALQPERDAIRSTISVVYNRWKDKNFQILSYTYEDFTSKVVENGQQSLYNRFIENEADIAVFIIKGFVGDKTIEEFDVAYNAYRNNKHLSIVVYYFPEGDESESVKAIKTKVQSKDQYWITVANIREMKLHFTDIINTDVWNLYTDEL